MRRLHVCMQALLQTTLNPPASALAVCVILTALPNCSAIIVKRILSWGPATARARRTPSIPPNRFMARQSTYRSQPESQLGQGCIPHAGGTDVSLLGLRGRRTHGSW
jgi:hypothetical protein